jgi:hypothetical protein
MECISRKGLNEEAKYLRVIFENLETGFRFKLFR